MPIRIKRKSDGQSFAVPASINPTSRVSELKKELHTHFKPKFEHGCRIIYQGKVLKSIHRLTHYGVQENTELEMDDSKNWSSSSSSSDSDRN